MQSFKVLFPGPTYKISELTLHLKIDLGGHLVTVIEVKQLDPYRKTLHRLTLEPSLDFPQSIIVKQQKDEWEDKFQPEIHAYKALSGLQGTVIPKLFCESFFKNTPALFLSDIAGTTLHNLARNDKYNI